MHLNEHVSTGIKELPRAKQLAIILGVGFVFLAMGRNFFWRLTDVNVDLISVAYAIVDVLTAFYSALFFPLIILWYEFTNRLNDVLRSKGQKPLSNQQTTHMLFFVSLRQDSVSKLTPELPAEISKDVCLLAAAYLGHKASRTFAVLYLFLMAVIFIHIETTP